MATSTNKPRNAREVQMALNAKAAGKRFAIQNGVAVVTTAKPGRLVNGVRVY
jgi:hypothetical protein